MGTYADNTQRIHTSPRRKPKGSLACARVVVGGKSVGGASRRWRFGLVLEVVLGLLWMTSFALAQPNIGNEDARFLAGLRERRLYQLAETYCRQRLQATNLDDVQRAELTIELARALAAKALELPPATSDSTWQQAVAAISDFATRFPQNSRAILVELQGALVHLAHGDVLREQADFSGGVGDRYGAARAELRPAIETLDQLRRRAADELRDAPNTSPKRERLTAAELVAVSDQLDRQLARAYRLQAGCSAPGTPDSIDGLNQAIGYLRQLLQRGITEELRWEAWLDLSACLRELGELDAARQALEQFDASRPPPLFALRARAERVRIALAAGLPRAALDVLAAGRAIDGQVSPELDTAFLETYLTLTADAHREERGTEADEYQHRADAVLAEIEKTHGPYWARRAELVASRGSATTGPGAGVELLVRTAERLHVTGQIDESLTAFDRAATSALESGDTQRAFELAFTAATIEHQRQEFAAASARYRAAAKQNPSATRAAEAHLLAAHDALEAAKLVEPLSTKHYRELLEEHLRLWPAGASLGEAQWRLGRLDTLERQWPQAVAAFRAITPQDARFVDAISATADAYAAMFAEQRAAGKDPTAQVVAAAREFERFATTATGEATDATRKARRASALAAARFWIEGGPANFGSAERLALQVVSDPEAPDEVRARALPLLVVALAGQGKTAEAQQRLQQMADAGPAVLLSVLESLSTTAESQAAESSRELALLELRTVELLRNKLTDLPAGAQQRFHRLEARALASAGKRSEAQAAYDALLKNSPRDGALREEFATFLSHGDDPASRTAGLAAWRDLERHSKQGTARWFRAKYGIALAHHQSGDDAQAAKVIALAKVLHPDLGGGEMRAKFTHLESQLKPTQKPPR